MKHITQEYGISKDSIIKGVELLAYVMSRGVSLGGFASNDEVNITNGLPEKIKEAKIKRIDGNLVFTCSVLESERPAILKVYIYPSDLGEKNVDWNGDKHTIRYLNLYKEEIDAEQKVVAIEIGRDKSGQEVPVGSLIDFSKTAVLEEN